MKIAFVVSYFPALSQTFVLNQVTGLIDRGHDVDIYSEHAGEQDLTHSEVTDYNLLKRTTYFGSVAGPYPERIYDRVTGVVKHLWVSRKSGLWPLLKALNVFRFGWYAATLQLFYKALAFVERGHDYDVFICHFGPNGNSVANMKELGLVRGKIITVFHGYDMSRHLKQHGPDAYMDIFRYGDLFLPISEKWQQELIRIGCNPRKIIVHRMGIDPEAFVPLQKGGRSTLNILSVGRLVEKKGFSFAIRSVAIALKKNPDIVFRIAGDGPLMDELSALVDSLGVNDKVILLGWQRSSDIAQLMSQADILLAPSVTDSEGDMEGVPVVLMEAMAKEIPVVSTWHSGIPELVQDRVAGLLVQERDVEALSDRLMFLIEHPDKCCELGRNGRQVIIKDFNIKTLNGRLEEICFQVTQDRLTS